VVVFGGRFDTHTAVFLGAVVGAGAAAAEASGLVVEDEVEAEAGVDPEEEAVAFPFPVVAGPRVVSVTSTSPTFLFFCFSILC